MPSVAHEQARTQTIGLVRTVAPPDDLVAGELAVLWDPRDLREHLMPDLMVARGVGQMDPVYGILRRQYRIWDEGKPPDLIAEFASPSTVGRDSLGKQEDYARMGVREYVQFDPLEELLQPGLRVYRLRGGVYRVVAPAADGSVASAVLAGYDWLQVGMHLRLRDQATGRLVPTPEEAQAAAEKARREAEARARAAEERVARLEAELRAALARSQDQQEEQG